MTSPLRILMVAPQPFFRPRGTPVSVLHRIRALRLLGHQVELLTYPFGTEPEEIRGIPIHRSLRPPLVKDVGIGPSVAKLLLDVPLFAQARRLVRSGAYDLIHTHEEAAFLGAVLSRRYGIPHLYDMHSSLPKQFRNFGKFNWRPVVAAFDRLERFALDRSQGVITVYPDLRDQVLARGYRGPLVVLENTMDFERKEWDGDALDAARERLGLNGRKVVVYTGTLEAYQGIELLLDAVGLLAERRSDLRVLLVGGNERQAADLAERARRMGIGDMVRFVGSVPPQEVFLYHDLADALITCRTRGTNTPLKIYQYLRSGRPIVATAIHSHTQVLDSDVAELVEPDPASVARGVDRILDDPARAARIAQEAKRLQEAHYSNEVYVRTLGDFLEQMRRTLDGRRPGRSPESEAAPEDPATGGGRMGREAASGRQGGD